MTSKLLQFLDLLIPQKIVIGPIEDYRKTQILLSICILLIVTVSITTMVMRSVFGFVASGVQVGYMLVLSVPILIWVFQAWKVVGIYFVTLGLTIIPWVVYQQGGLISSSSVWFCLTPVLAASLLGLRWGIISTVVGLAGIILLFFLGVPESSFMGIPKYDVSVHFYYAIRLITVCSLVGASACLYAWNTEKTEKKLQNLNLQLEHEVVVKETANRAKTNFLANISHEIRTPLSSMIGFAELLQFSSLTDEEREEYTQAVYRNSIHLRELIDDLLDLSKIEAGKLEMERLSFSLRDQVEKLNLIIGPHAEEKGIEIKYDYHESVPDWITSDPVRFRQILINIIGNAIKFTLKGMVHVHFQLLSKPSGVKQLEIIISDTGCGIDAKKVRTLFTPFSQEDMSLARKYGGTGLGLVLSRRFAKALGGDVKLVTTEKGTGSTFRITVNPDPINVANHPVPTAEVSESKPDVKELQGVKVLLVEDVEDTQKLLKLFLKKAGAEVSIAGNGLEAVTKCSGKETFDVILMDIQMPVVNGYRATEELRRKGCQCPIIALTAHALREEKKRCLDVGCDDYLIKPVNTSLLVKTVSSWYQRRRG